MSYILSTYFPKKIRTIFLFLALALLLTPENMGIGSYKTGPIIFSFIFELIFEQSLSIRTLRPLVFTVPLAFILSLLFLRFKRRFSQS